MQRYDIIVRFIITLLRAVRKKSALISQGKSKK